MLMAPILGGPLPPAKLGYRFSSFRVRKSRPMRLLVISVAFFGLGAAAASAQTIPSPASPASLTTLRLLPSAPPPAGMSSHRQSPGPPQSREKQHESDVADCMQMWDSGTHMTKQVWARTCKRVQSRLDNLKIEALMPATNRRVP